MTLVVIKKNSTTTDELIVGQSQSIRLLKSIIDKVAISPASVLITGRSGSGKEVVARALHAASPRSKGPFIAINCGAIPPELIESELFGHERGSFTGAIARRLGKFEEADGGTIFLDEIGDMRPDMQVKLLRVLEERMITRIGSATSIPVDVRVISATHQDIDLAIAENRFREDLYFRLGVVPIHVPDLGSRIEDVPILLSHFQKQIKHASTVKIDASGLNRLMQHGWPGNVRELRNLVERAGVLFAGETIGWNEMEQLLELKRINRAVVAPAIVEQADISVLAQTSSAQPVFAMPSRDIPIDLKSLLETMELERIQFALDLADGVVTNAARMLTLKRTTLLEKMRKYRLEKA
jgi:sigma-54 dependent transcriptional regulator, flagellar regulatory protein